MGSLEGEAGAQENGCEGKGNFGLGVKDTVRN